MCKPLFIRSSQEDFKSGNNIYNFTNGLTNVPINITNIISICKSEYSQSFAKREEAGGPYIYHAGYQIRFHFPSLEGKLDYICWLYVNELMRDSDYERILQLFEVKL